MEYHSSTRLRARSPRSEPSWPQVIATTLRLYFQRHPFVGPRASRGRKAALAGVVTLVLAGIVAGTASTVFSSGAAVPAASTTRGSAAGAPAARSGGSGTSALGASAATRTTAARWIAAQVASSAVVGCDPAMCASLQAGGLPAARLLALGPAASDPLGSDLVVATAAVRNEFGPRLESVYAPGLIASFGTGAGRIDVRAIAPDGAAAYQSSLAADRQARAAAGVQLLGNHRIAASASVRASLRAGDVDSRLLTVLAALAAQQPVRVVALGDPSPGAGTTAPLRSAQLAPVAAGAHARAALAAMLSFVQGQQQPYRPQAAAPDGSSALTVEYAAPSPLGLLSGS